MHNVVLIANYNNSTWIGKAIESAKKQTVECKICVVDDCSTDDSIEVIKGVLFNNSEILPSVIDDENGYFKYEENGNILICLNKNSGPSMARNVGIEQTISNTKYYCILDADDEMYPNKLEEYLKVADNHPNVGIIYADYDIYNTITGNTLREYKHNYSRSHLLKECIIHSGALIRASELKRVFEPSGWYDINLEVAEDWDLWLRMTEKCIAWHIPKSLSFVRVHDNNSTNSVKKEIWNQCWIRVQQKIRERHVAR